MRTLFGINVGVWGAQFFWAILIKTDILRLSWTDTMEISYKSLSDAHRGLKCPKRLSVKSCDSSYS